MSQLIPYTGLKPLTLSTTQTLSGNNTTVATPIFRVTGIVEVTALYGIVTTVLGSNNTAAHWRINDQTAQQVISLVTGTTLSSAPVGSLLSRHSLVTIALILSTSATGVVKDPVAATAKGMFMPFIVVQKTGGIQTDIEFVYTTTNTPTSGVIKWYLEYLPRSDDGAVAAV